MHHAIVLGNIPTKMSGHLSDFDIFYECCWQPWQTRQVYPISVCVLGCLQSTNVHFFLSFFLFNGIIFRSFVQSQTR